MTRQLIVVDCETSGLSEDAIPLEIAAVNLDTGKSFYMIPFVSMADIADAEPKALQINRYFERGLRDSMITSHEETGRSYKMLAEFLRGNTFAGSNPRFDSRILSGYIAEVWHHRLADLAAYAAPALGRGPHNLPGLADVCEELGVKNTEPHSALGDARATAECFRRLINEYAAYTE